METNVFRGLSGLVGLAALLNGLLMLADPLGWFAGIPDLAATGLPNPHLIRDVGVAYVATACGLGVAAWRPHLALPALAPATVFMLGHGLTHIADILAGRAAAPCGTATDWLAVVTPGVLTLGLVLWSLRVGRTPQPAK